MYNRISNRQDNEMLLAEVYEFHGQEIYTDLENGIAKKKLFFRIAFPLIRFASYSRLGNFVMLFAVLLFYREFRKPESAKAIFQYGTTDNNKKAFELLNGCLDEQLRTQISTNGHLVELGSRLQAAFGLKSLVQAAGVLTRHRHKRALPHVQGIIALAARLFYLRHPLSTDLKVLCVASDHPPMCQAILFAARQQGIKTCYVQHAPVTQYFPPLKFDLSFLYDRASVAAYTSAAERVGVAMQKNVVILPPFAETFQQPSLLDPPYRVGICLSFVPNIDHVAQIIKRLHQSTSVAKVLLRRHPRCHQDLSYLLRDPKTEVRPQGEDAEKFFKAIDIALAPSSGVAVQALHYGCPTFYTPGTDDLPHDYYRFVETGILPEFSVADLGQPEKLVAFFDAKWLTRFCDHDETAKVSLSKARSDAAEAITSLLSE